MINYQMIHLMLSNMQEINFLVNIIAKNFQKHSFIKGAIRVSVILLSCTFIFNTKFEDSQGEVTEKETPTRRSSVTNRKLC